MAEDGEIGATPEAKDAFSIDVAREWERVFAEAHTPGTRKVALRAAMVLGLGKNSVFPVLRRLVRLGLGGRNRQRETVRSRGFMRMIIAGQSSG